MKKPQILARENDYCSITMPCGRKTLFDFDDMDLVSQYKWYSLPDCNGGYYASSKFIDENGRWRMIRMSRLIMSAKKGICVDHINHNGLDNRRKNLRLCTKHMNCFNKKMQKNNVSGYMGVSWSKITKKWTVGIKINGKRKHLGYFTDPQEASRVYQNFKNNLIKKSFQEFNAYRKDF